MTTKYQVITKKAFGFGTYTFNFKSLVNAKNYASENMHKLVDVLEVKNNEFTSILN